MINVASLLDIGVRRCPEATAFIHLGRRYSYRQIERCANRIANGLIAEGFGPGSRIALSSHNRPALPAAFFGILKTGATVVMLNAHATRRDLQIGLRDSEADALLAQDRRAGESLVEATLAAFEANERCRKLWFLTDALEEPGAVEGHPTLGRLMAGAAESCATAPVGPDDVAVVAFTSGTTGRRKGVQTTHANIVSMVAITAQLGDPDDCRMRIAGNTLDCLMGVLYTLVQPVYLGQCVVLVPSDDPEHSLRELLRWGGSYLVDVPYVYRKLLEAASDRDAEAVRRSLRICVTGGAHLAGDLPQLFLERFGTPLLEGYGATETTTAITWTCPGDHAVPGSVGRPLPGVAVELRDAAGRPCPAGEPGEIWVRSPGTMKGYLNMPEATREALVAGWYRTSDLGHLGEGGELYFHRRLDNKINQGIDQVDPLEVEALLLEHPAVRGARVLAEPHAELGELARGYVVLGEGCPRDRAALLGWLRSELPYGKSPESLEIVPVLPPRDGGASPIARRTTPPPQRPTP